MSPSRDSYKITIDEQDGSDLKVALRKELEHLIKLNQQALEISNLIEERLGQQNDADTIQRVTYKLRSVFD